jgi:hypothetical protein
MTITTNQKNSSSRRPSPVTDLAERRSRRRLEHLLNLRAQLAGLSAERRAHDLDDAAETYGQQLAVENAISEEFPDVYEERFPTWVTRDVELEHDAGALHFECGICQAVAKHVGLNLTPPEAA